MKLAIASLLFGSSAAFSPALSGNKFTSSTQLSARKPFISGNWKLNPQTKDEAIALAGAIAGAVNEESPDADVALFVPYVFIESVMEKVGDWINIGAEVSFNDLFFLYDCVFDVYLHNNKQQQRALLCNTKPIFIKLRLYFRVYAQRWLEPTLVPFPHLCSNPLAFNGLLPDTLNVV
mmetsp:Transcript_1549/g.2613  ORF Transcript_1549/g.2613 Transcript_1549/m.2613 type:complete len:177 (+) Transcript_1549:82-612(+)